MIYFDRFILTYPTHTSINMVLFITLQSWYH